MNSLQKNVAEMAIRLLSLPSDAFRDSSALADIERLANQVLREAAALRASASPHPGEQAGAWRIYKTGS